MVRLRSSDACQSEIDSSSIAPGVSGADIDVIPALLTSTSAPPKARSAHESTSSTPP